MVFSRMGSSCSLFALHYLHPLPAELLLPRLPSLATRSTCCGAPVSSGNRPAEAATIHREMRKKYGGAERESCDGVVCACDLRCTRAVTIAAVSSLTFAKDRRLPHGHVRKLRVKFKGDQVTRTDTQKPQKVGESCRRSVWVHAHLTSSHFSLADRTRFSRLLLSLSPLRLLLPVCCILRATLSAAATQNTKLDPRAFSFFLVLLLLFCSSSSRSLSVALEAVN